MEADAYERINSALTNRSRRTNLPVRFVSGIDRLVWSVWDYIVGPELRFVWDVIPSELDQLTATAIDTDGETIAGSDCSSSFDKRQSSVDDASSGEFISHFHENSLDPTDADIGLVSGTSEVRVCDNCSSGGSQVCPHTDSSEVLTEWQSQISQANSHGDPLQSSHSTVVDSEASDSMIDSTSTPFLNLRISVTASLQSSQCNDNMPVSSRSDDCAITTSSSSPPPAQPIFGVQSVDSSSGDESMESREHASTIDNGTEMSDEQYVAVHTLSSEIYRNHYSNDVEFKLMMLSERRLAVAAYVFAAKHRDQTRAVHSLSFLMKDVKAYWFLRMKRFCSLYLDDLIPRLKAALCVESYEELLSRMTTEFSQLLNLLGELENESFASWGLHIADTLLMQTKMVEDEFLRNCIAAHLQCQGQTVVIGEDVRRINRLLRTLGFFVPEEDRILCRHAVFDENVEDKRKDAKRRCPYSPYLKVQGFKKSETRFILQHAVYSPWPVCLIDVETQTVSQSLPWKRHMDIRRETLRRDVGQILIERNVISMSADVQNYTKRRSLAEMRVHDLPETIVKRFLQQMDFLPYDNRVREGFVEQFMRHLGHRALALDAYVREATDNGNKRNDLRISKMRKALDLEAHGNFLVVLAVTDRLRPGFTDYLMTKE